MRGQLYQQVSNDVALDYLFQRSVEEQFASLMPPKSQPEVGLIGLVKTWFQRRQSEADPYDEYYAVEDDR